MGMSGIWEDRYIGLLDQYSAGSIDRERLIEALMAMGLDRGSALDHADAAHLEPPPQ